jgi:hexosaminidase
MKRIDCSPIVPQPVVFKRKTGIFKLSEKTALLADAGTMPIRHYLAHRIERATGFVLGSEKNIFTTNTIELSIAKEPAISPEAYRMDIAPSYIKITGSSYAGVFYGVQSLLQLFPPDIWRDARIEGIEWMVPCTFVEDFPRFGWRGLMLDTGRYFMPINSIKRLLELMAMYKLNNFHWHLTEDQGWRIEIKKYPLLTEVGAWRAQTVVNHQRNMPQYFDGIPHGGFYSQNDVKEIIQYAKERAINVLPEIEMPGHTQSAIAAYPQLGNLKEKLPVSCYWGVHKNILNVEDSTIKFFQNVLKEIMELFPSEFIHIGGDEAMKDQWRTSKRAQKKIKQSGLKNEEELQSWFIKQMDTFLNKNGRRLVGWDEILEGGIAKNATVMSWRGAEGGIKAAKAGHDVVMARSDFTYFDYYQDKDINSEPLAIGGMLPLEKVYSFEPVPSELTSREAKHILGSQGQVWTEYIPTFSKVEYMAFPRACALAEVVWSQQEAKNYGNFLMRLKENLKRLDVLGVQYRKLTKKS